MTDPWAPPPQQPGPPQQPAAGGYPPNQPGPPHPGYDPAYSGHGPTPTSTAPPEEDSSVQARFKKIFSDVRILGRQPESAVAADANFGTCGKAETVVDLPPYTHGGDPRRISRRLFAAYPRGSRDQCS